jgi:Ser/Thr protein kinase RdoA (MazF antagonist)
MSAPDDSVPDNSTEDDATPGNAAPDGIQPGSFGPGSEYAALDPGRVIDAVEATGRLSDARVLVLNSYENRVYQVGLEEGAPVIVKFYRPGRWSDAQILEEHRFLLELAAAELPVVAPLADSDGNTLFYHQGYRYTLFPRRGGQAPEPGDLDQLYRLGMLLGRTHAVSARETFQARPTLDIQRYFDAPVAVVRREGFLPASLQAAHARVTAALRERLVASGIESAPRIRTHGDTHPGNVIWTRDDGPWLVDFDDCQSAPAVQDLWMLLTGERHEQETQLGELLEGYQQFHDFDAAELRYIEALRSLRMVHYAGWLATRWEDPAFPKHFPWFNTADYWRTHIAELEVQCERMDDEPLRYWNMA